MLWFKAQLLNCELRLLTMTQIYLKKKQTHQSLQIKEHISQTSSVSSLLLMEDESEIN